MNSPFIIAEIGVNHNGNLQNALQLIDMAVSCGVDAVKFQTFNTNKVVLENSKKAQYQEMAPGLNQFDMLKTYELKSTDFEIIKDYCGEKNIEFISTPFDNDSVHLLDKLNVNYIKVSSGDLTNYPLLFTIAKTGKKIILSTGMSDDNEICSSVNYLEKCLHNNNIDSNDKLVLMHCVSSYPTKLCDANINCMTSLNKFGFPIGFSDHTEGYIASIIAVSVGAKYIEKHITLDKNQCGPDHKFSLSHEELYYFVKLLRSTNVILGNNFKKCVGDENEVKQVARRCLVFNKNLQKGHRIGHDDIIGIRPLVGICCSEYENFISKILNIDVKEHDVISYDMFYDL